MPMIKQSAAAGQTTVPGTKPLSKRASRRERQKAAEAVAIYAKPLVAVRCDGALLVSTADLTERDLAGREVETYVKLTEPEASTMLRSLVEHAGEAAARLAAALPERRNP